MLARAGFENISVNDRRFWHLEQAKSELDAMQNTSRDRFIAAIGKENADADIDCWKAMIKVQESGEFGEARLVANKSD